MNNFGSATPGLQCLGLFSSYGWARGGRTEMHYLGHKGSHQGGIREEFLVCADPSLTPEFPPARKEHYYLRDRLTTSTNALLVHAASTFG